MNETWLPKNYPMYGGIIGGISKGKLWTDPKNPDGLMIIYSYCVGGYGITGDIEGYTDFMLKEFFDEFLAQRKEEGEEWFEFSSESELIYERLLNLFKDKEIISEMEFSYRRSVPYDIVPTVDSTIELKAIDEEVLNLLQQDKVKNAEMFLERFRESWHSRETFLERSKAYIAIKENKVIGVVFGSARYENVITVDIEVLEEYQKQGIGKALAICLMNDCSKEGLVLQWDCVESNIASRALVKSLAFQPLQERPYYWFKL